MLVLPIEKKWFDMIKTGKKKEEYREIKPNYDKRLGKAFIGFPFTHEIVQNFKSIKRFDKEQIKETEIIFRNGYNNNSPQFICKCNLRIGQGKPEWGAEEGKEYYVLEILEVAE